MLGKLRSISASAAMAGLCLLSACVKETPLPQAPSFQFTYGGKGNEVAGGAVELPNGGFLIVGGSQDVDNGRYDLLVLNIGADGKEKFSNTFGEADADEVGWKVITNNVGEYVILGTTRPKNGGVSALQLTLLDADLKVRWQTTSAINIPNSGLTLHGADFYQMADGGYIAGFSTEYDLAVVRFDNGGHKIDEDLLDGFVNDGSAHIFAQAADSGFVMATTEEGYYLDHLTFARYDAYGNYLNQVLSPIPSGLYPRVQAIEGLRTGDFGISVWDQATGQHMVGRLNPDLTVDFLLGRTDSPYYNEINELPSGRLFYSGFDSYYQGGYYGIGDNFRVLLIDSSGADVRLANYGGQQSDRLRKAVPTSDGRVMLLGETLSYGAGGADLYVAFFNQ